MSDTLFDTSERAMAERFGVLAIARMRAGRDPYEAARLAVSYAAAALADTDTSRVFRFADAQRRARIWNDGEGI